MHPQVKSELVLQEQQVEEMSFLEKKRERERTKAESFDEDITFKTTMGVWRREKERKLGERERERGRRRKGGREREGGRERVREGEKM